MNKDPIVSDSLKFLRKHGGDMNHEQIQWQTGSPPESLEGVCLVVLVKSPGDGVMRVQVARYDGECLRGDLWMQQEVDEDSVSWVGSTKGVIAWMSP